LGNTSGPTTSPIKAHSCSMERFRTCAGTCFFGPRAFPLAFSKTCLVHVRSTRFTRPLLPVPVRRRHQKAGARRGRGRIAHLSFRRHVERRRLPSNNGRPTVRSTSAVTVSKFGQFGTKTDLTTKTGLDPPFRHHQFRSRRQSGHTHQRFERCPSHCFD
jgi:hypothetical protein